ncbi:LamG-like jellyroll fold domain-containing protein [Pedobacter cryophilus]|uniref:T9SS type A sorting domain-containing protein n=1 Tax=Pedobacter cryophilus TaxID=2571271 RepID=A0A4U1BUD1_9SPHI|nr:LamG-like jellyroll fold domain-containing protein [Pedobacter cryophilus]TKB96248.1 T9SS type A sorting domain-containing protein [Pedobacter cryophilus]
MLIAFFLSVAFNQVHAQTLAFPGAKGFGRYALGARGAASQQVYVVTNLNNSGAGSFRDAVSQQGRIVVFAVSGIINLATDIVVPPNTTIAGQTAPGEGIVLFGKRVTFSSSSNTIARYIRIRLGATDNAGKDASGISNGANIIFDHMTFTWGMDEVFSINWDNKGTSPDNITIQNSIIGQGLHRNNHSAGGLMQPSTGKISLIGNLYTSNKTRNPKVKGINEFVNNVVYNWGNANRLGDIMNYGWSGEAYIMGGDSEGISHVNIINNYFIGGPSTNPSTSTPFNRGNSNFNLYGAGNYMDNNKDGVLNGTLIPSDLTGYPTGDINSLQSVAYDYPAKNPVLTAQQSYDYICDSVGASYPKRDQVDSIMIADLRSKGTSGIYVYRETDLPFSNGGVGNVFSAPAPLDTDSDGMPDVWEDANGLNKNNAADAVTYNINYPEYLNIEVYINSLTSITPPVFIIPPSNITFNATSVELPSPASTIVVNWNDNSNNENNFVIERSLNGTTFTQIAQVGANVITYTDLNLVPNTKYYYRLKAVNSTESSSYSAVSSVTTPPIPTAPTKASGANPINGFNFVELSSGNLSLKWTGSSNTTTYEVYFGTTASNLTKLGDVAYTAAPTYLVNGLASGSTYFWRIDALNNKGSATGDVWSFRTIANVAVGTVGYWAFDETLSAGTQITDSTTYINHGVLGLDDDDATIRVLGKVKNALDFATARTDIYVVSVPSQDQLYLDKSSFSVSFWMKAASALLPTGTNSSYLMCKGSITKNTNTGATGKRFDIEFKSSQFRFAIDDDVTKKELATSATPFFTGDWVHVVVMRDVSDNKLKLYLNGTLLTTLDATGVTGIGEASSLVVGNIGELEFLATTNLPAPYKGQLDELKVFNYALTPQQVLLQYHTSPLPIQAYTPFPTNTGVADDALKANVTWAGGINTTHYKLYLGTSSGVLNYIDDRDVSTPNYQFTNLIANTPYFWRVDAVGAAGTTTGSVWSFTTSAFAIGIVADWHLDATSGTTITDHSTYANSGTIDNVSAYQWIAGRLNNGLNLQTMTTGSTITIPHQNQIKFDKNSFSISFWIKANAPASASTSAYVLNKGAFARNTSTGTNGRWYGLELKNNLIYFSVDDDVTKSTVSLSSANFLTNAWVHVVLIRDLATNTLKIYRGGTLAISGADNTGITNGIGNTDPLLFANASGLTAPFTGALDEIKIYNYALTPSEITTLSTGAVLPVSLSSYTANEDGNSVRLNWTTLSEQNNNHFLIEKSIDGVSFNAIANLKGKGTTNEVSNYVAYDKHPFNGNNYYRLQQYDNDGAIKNLGIKVVKFGITNQDVLIYPNPTLQRIHIKMPTHIETANVTIRNLNGAQVYQNIINVQNQLLMIDLENKPSSGIYLLEINALGFTKSAKIIVK